MVKPCGDAVDVERRADEVALYDVAAVKPGIRS
jgi:hypothetical protein